MREFLQMQSTRSQRSFHKKKRAMLLAFGEIGYEGGLGRVASAAVIG